MVIRYSDGSYVEAVIHRLEAGTVRAAVAGIDDAIEYSLIGDQWTSERGVVVTFEFSLDLDEEMSLFPIIPVTNGAPEAGCVSGGDCLLRRMPGPGAGRVN